MVVARQDPHQNLLNSDEDLHQNQIFGVGVVVVVPLLDFFSVVVAVPFLLPLLLGFYVVCHINYCKSFSAFRSIKSHLPNWERSDYLS